MNYRKANLVPPQPLGSAWSGCAISPGQACGRQGNALWMNWSNGAIDMAKKNQRGNREPRKPKKQKDTSDVENSVSAALRKQLPGQRKHDWHYLSGRADRGYFASPQAREPLSDLFYPSARIRRRGPRECYGTTRFAHPQRIGDIRVEFNGEQWCQSR